MEDLVTTDGVSQSVLCPISIEVYYLHYCLNRLKNGQNMVLNRIFSQYHVRAGAYMRGRLSLVLCVGFPGKELRTLWEEVIYSLSSLV